MHHGRAGIRAKALRRRLWIVAGFGTTFAAAPDLAAMLKRRWSAGPLGALRFVDCFATSDRVEHGCRIDQSPEHRRSQRGADSAAVRPSYGDKQKDAFDSDPLCILSRSSARTRTDTRRPINNDALG